MKFKPVLEKYSPEYGNIFDLDFTSEFKEYNINLDNIPLESKGRFNSILTQDKLREVIYLEDIQESSLYRFYKENINKELIDDFINFDEQIKINFRENYPFSNYGSSLEFLNSFTGLGAMVCLDQKGFRLPKHFDNRLMMGSFVINLDNNTDSTKFWINNNLSHTGPTEYGKGVFFFNNHHTLHSIEVQNDNLRKALIINVGINN